MRPTRLFAAALFALSVGAPPLAAQHPGQADLVEVLEIADDDGEFLRVTTVDGEVTEGYIRQIDEAVLRLGGGAVELQIIERVEVRRRDDRGPSTGALIGGLVVGSAFAAVGLLIAGFCEHDCSRAEPLIGAAAGGTIGALLGTLLGGAIAPGETEWALVWSRQD